MTDQPMRASGGDFESYSVGGKSGSVHNGFATLGRSMTPPYAIATSGKNAMKEKS